MPASSLPPLLPALPGEPRHQRAARSLREAIVRGELAAGERLSTRRLAQGWGLGRNTVQDGLEQLQSEGYLEVRAQSGSYVAPGVSQRAFPLAAAGDDLPRVPLSGWAVRALSGERPDAPADFRVDFRLGQPAGLFPSQLWAEALARRAADPAGLLEGGELGPLPTRQAIALWLSRERGAAVTPEMVMLTGGTQPALDLLARTYLEAGRTAVIEDPGYPGAGRAFAATGATLWPSPTDEQGMQVGGLPTTASLAYLTPGCQFPGTATLSAPRRAALLEWARDAQTFIIEDDYAADFHHQARPPAPLQALAPGRVILLGTFSQSLAPALRSGYLVAPPGVLEVLARTRPLTDRHPPTLDALALSDFLTSGGYARHLRRARAQVAHRHEVLREALRRELPRLTPRPTHAGLHLLLPLPAGTDEPTLRASAARQGLGVSLLSDYRQGGGPSLQGPALLLAFAHLTPDGLRDGVRRLRAALDGAAS